MVGRSDTASMTMRYEAMGRSSGLWDSSTPSQYAVAERDDVRLAQVERGVAQRVERFEHHALEARTCVLGLSTVLLGLGQVGARGLEAPNQKGGWGGGLSAGCEYQLSISLRLIRGSLVWSWAVGRSASALCLGGAGQTVARARACCVGVC